MVPSSKCDVRRPRASSPHCKLSMRRPLHFGRRKMRWMSVRVSSSPRFVVVYATNRKYRGCLTPTSGASTWSIVLLSCRVWIGGYYYYFLWSKAGACLTGTRASVCSPQEKAMVGTMRPHRCESGFLPYVRRSDRSRPWGEVGSATAISPPSPPSRPSAPSPAYPRAVSSVRAKRAVSGRCAPGPPGAVEMVVAPTEMFPATAKPA